MKYQLFPNLTSDEMEALTADIKARGVMVPVELDENGDILDGHHRAMIADSLGIGYPTIVREGWSEDQKLVHVVALNAHRRQLTATERAEVVATLRKARLSTRAIAKAVGVGKDTVRRDLAAGAIAPPDAVTGTDGKSYPAHQPFRPRLDPIGYFESKPDAPRLQRPPTAREEEARRRSVWAGLAVRLTEVVTFDPTEYVPLLDPTQRHAWSAYVSDMRSWLDSVEAALSDRPMRVVSGGTR